MNTLSRKQALKTCAIILVFFWACSRLSGQTTWVNPGAGNWFNAGNWSAGVPNSGTDAQINNSGSAQIGAAGANAQTLSLGLNALDSGTLSITGPGTFTTSNDLFVGDSGTGNLTIQNGGTASVNRFGYIGAFAGSNGTALVDGTGSTLTITNGLYVGYFGTGTLTVQNGGTVSSNGGYIGYFAGGNATVLVDHATWNSSFGMHLGFEGTATMTIQNGGAVTNIGSIGGFSGHGALLVDGVGSTLTNIGTIFVGDGGDGTLTIRNGAAVSNGDAIIGRINGGHGTVLVDGLGSTWTNNGNLEVGEIAVGTATGTLTIQNGGAVSSTGAEIAGFAGVQGAVVVDGTGSTWTVSTALSVGGMLTIRNGGTVSSDFGSVDGTAIVDGAGSTWTISGQLNVGFVNAGTLRIANGGAVSNSTGIIGWDSGASGSSATVTGAGSTWTISDNFYVGFIGNGTLDITNGARVDVLGSLSIIGSQAANVIGIVNVSGAGSTWTTYAGELRVGNLGIGTLNITEGGNVFDTDGFIGKVSGSSGLVSVDGLGSLWLSNFVGVGGDNVGAGGTGILRIQNQGRVLAPTIFVWSTGTLEVGQNPIIDGVVTFDGGTLRTIADTTYAKDSIIALGGMIIDSNGFDSQITGRLNGGGGLTKINSGTIVLTNANIYIGNTNINDGSLIVDGSILSTTFVNSGGLLGGTGTIFGSVFNSGVVSPGHSPGTLTLANSYTQNAGGILRIEIAGLAATQHDLLAVGGAAALDGVLQLLRLNPFTPQPGDTVTVLTAGGGTSGTFASVDSSSFNTVVQPRVMVHANDVQVVFVQGSFNIDGLTPNQRAVGENLNVALSDPGAGPLISFLNTEPLGNLPHDYDLIAPEELASIYEIGFSQAVVQNNNLQRRMDDIRAGSNGFCANGFAPQVSGKDYTKGSNGDISLPENKRDVYIPAPDNRWGVFVTGTGDFVNVGNDDINARGYDIMTGDFTVGADYRLCDHFAIGIDAGYSRSTADLVDDGRVDVDGGKVGAYATVFGKGLFDSKFYVDGSVGGGFNSYDTRRTGLQDEFVRGSTDGSEFNAMISYGSDWTFGCFNIGTWSTVQYTNVSIDEFTETGSLAPLIIQDQDENSFRATTGVHASYDIKAGHFIFRPEVRAAYQHEYCDRAYQIDSRFASGAGNIFRVRGPDIGRDAALVGAGMSVQWNNRLSTYVYYDGVLGRNNYDNNAVSGGFRVAF